MRNTQRMPLSTARASRQGRPRPSGRRWRVSKGLSTCHCASVKSMLLIYASLYNSQARNGLNVFMRQLLGSVAEMERSMIVERVKAGMRNARSKGKHIGRPRVSVDAKQIWRLSALGTPWRTIGEQLGVSARTAKRIALQGGKSV